jgi:pyruvate dehydrogenase E2 component (dihydrolipoamide acetyltransferase)
VAVETEKAVVEIPSPKAGHIARFVAKVGDRVAVGAPLLEFEEGPHAESGAIVGELPGPAVPPGRAGVRVSVPPAATIRAAPAVRRASSASI